MNNATCAALKADCGDGDGAGADAVPPGRGIAGEGGDGNVGAVSVRNSAYKDFSDDEISTKKELHWRLGPADLNDTLKYDYPDLQPLLEGDALGAAAPRPA